MKRLVVVFAVALAAFFANVATSSAAQGCGVVNHNICMSITDVDPISPNGFGKDIITVTNGGGNTVNQLTYSVSGARFTSTTGGGIISADGGTVTVSAGQLKPGGTSTITVQYRSLSSPGTINVCGTVAWNEGAKNGGRQDTATVCEPTTVSDSAGQSVVPAKEDAPTGVNSVTIRTAPNQAQTGIATIPLLSNFSTVANVGLVVENAVAGWNCLLGSITIQGQVYACRNGSWVDLSVPGGSYSASNPLRVSLDYPSGPLDGSLNIVSFHAPSTGGGVDGVSDLCGSPRKLPCNESETVGGGRTRIVALRGSNGRYR